MAKCLFWKNIWYKQNLAKSEISPLYCILFCAVLVHTLVCPGAVPNQTIDMTEQKENIVGGRVGVKIFKF